MWWTDILVCLRFAADGERLSHKIVSLGLGLDEVEGVTRRLVASHCGTAGLSTGRSHACLRQPQDLPEHTLLGQPQGVCRARQAGFVYATLRLRSQASLGTVTERRLLRFDDDFSPGVGTGEIPKIDTNRYLISGGVVEIPHPDVGYAFSDRHGLAGYGLDKQIKRFIG